MAHQKGEKLRIKLLNDSQNLITPQIAVFPDGRMDTRNASLYLGLSSKTLAMWRCQGIGPKFIKRGRIFYFKEDMDAWIQAGRCTSTAQRREP
jgi:hypothetical protein